jgi:hypothetical protein
MSAVKVEVGFSAEDYMKKFDPATKIRDGLAKLGARCMFESDLAKLCGMTPQLFTAHKKPFAVDFLVREAQTDRDKPVWAGSKALAAKLRGDTNG